MLVQGVMGRGPDDPSGATPAYRQRHPLIGREVELRAIIARLRSADAAVLTITGRDGSGRTRLGLAALDAVAPDLPGGAAILSLADIPDAGTLLTTLAAILEVSHDAMGTAEAAVAQRLLQLPTAILCDDADGRVELVAVLARLVTAGGGRLLASARRPMGLDGEIVIRLGPLGLPDPAEVDPKAIAGSPAVQLYLVHARAADHRFEPDAATLPVIAEVCRRLDGLPGPIELAAARVTLLPPAMFLARLDRAPLAAGVRRASRDASGRATALGAAIASVHGTLGADAATVLRRVAVLHGPAPLDALEAIAGDPEWSPDRLLDAIADLVDCHLLDVPVTSEPRFRLPHSVAAFAREQLDAAGERELATLRRDAWCLQAMDGAGDRLDGPRPAPSVEDLLACQEDLLRRGDLAGSLRLAADGSPTWVRDAWPPLAQRLMAEALSRAAAGEAAVPPAILTRVRIWQARLITERPDAPPPAVQAEQFRGLVEEARATGDPRLLLLALAARALAMPMTLDLAGAAESVQEGLALSATVGDPYWVTRFLYWSGMAAAGIGEYRMAAQLGSQGLAAALASDDRWAVIPASILLVNLAQLGEPIPPSTPSPEALLDMARQHGFRAAEGWVLASMAHQAVEQGDTETAIARATELLHVGQRQGAWSVLIIAIAALARSAIDLRDWPMAARFSGMIARDLPMILATSMAERRARFQAAFEEARGAAGVESWDAHAAAGALLSPVAAIHEALAWAEARARTGSPMEGARAGDPAGDGEAGRLATEPLTPREEQVLRRIARGDSNKDIAADLGMSPKTVMHHSMSIYRKLGVRGRSEATAWAFRSGLVERSGID